ncbi:MAG: hypothetical protein GDA49_00830 [Rhodospirillales bacterium]|nr:hypothetical protein [Rhodospirillales bacterium]
MDGLTPPPISGPPPVPASRIMPASGLSDAEYVGAFLEEFGAAPGKPVVFTDVIGEPVVITDAFFRLFPGGPYKVDKRGRQKFIRVIADTIRQPDEIWWVWEERSGEMTLRRHHVAHWTVPGQDARLTVVMDVAPDGWRGVTAFEVDKSRELEKRRRGTLAWRRSQERPDAGPPGLLLTSLTGGHRPLGVR